MSAVLENIDRAAWERQEREWGGWHPLLPNPTPEQIERLKGSPEGPRVFAEFCNKRKRRISLADEETGDPYYYGFEPWHWKRADEEQRRALVGLYVSGGIRATKSERAAKRTMKACCKLSKGKVWIFQGGEKTAVAMQHQLVWKYLPREWKALNSRVRHGTTKINWSQDGGFTEGVMVLPNRTEVHFLTYTMEPKRYQGWSIGFPRTEENLDALAADPELENIGAWLDEDAPLNWLETCEGRCTTNRAKLLWTFTTREGITPAVKEVLGTPITIESRRAELLPANRVHVDGCPPGEMPFIQEAGRHGWRVIYFHSDLNVFGESYAGLKVHCEGKPEDYIKENAYGWSKDTQMRVWGSFGEVNVVSEEALPREGTNYTFTDPAGGRNWATVWVRVAEGSPETYFIYRDWPDEKRYGPWAVPGDAKAGAHANPDGDAGPAQRSLNLGFGGYKRMLLDQERIVVGPELRATLRELRKAVEAAEGFEEKALERLREYYKDPQRAWLVWKRWQECLGSRDAEPNFDNLQEVIHERFMDPRAGRNKQVAEQRGGTCIIDEMAKVSKDERTGEVRAPGMLFYPASGVHKAEGFTAVDELLSWEKEKPAIPLVNFPRLFVSRNCKQVIWTLLNYTDQGGEYGACKDFADLLRYMALARLRYVGDGKLKTSGGGSY